MFFDIDKFLNTPIKVLEKLDWYDLISAMGLESFNWSGTKPMDTILKEMEMKKGEKLLMVGCGAGGNPLYFMFLEWRNSFIIIFFNFR